MSLIKSKFFSGDSARILFQFEIFYAIEGLMSLSFVLSAVWMFNI